MQRVIREVTVNVNDRPQSFEASYSVTSRAACITVLPKRWEKGVSFDPRASITATKMIKQLIMSRDRIVNQIKELYRKTRHPLKKLE